jgi:cytochrome c
MDSFEWNKIIGAVLGSLIFIFVVKTVASIIYEPEKPAKAGYIVEGVTEEGAGPVATVAEEIPDFGTVLPTADVGAGKNIAQRCLQCHTLNKGEPSKIGPNLYGVVDRPRASFPGFSYSSAMKAKGGTWTYDELFKFLHSPGAYINGTKMSFAGLRNAQDRINVIAFLRSNADSPAPIPAPAPKTAAPAAEAAGAAKPADGKAAATPAAATKAGAPAETSKSKLAPGKAGN